MSRTPDEYAVHFMLSGGHREEVIFATTKDFQKWYSNNLMPKADETGFITIPIKNIEGEFMVVRPSSIMAIRMEPRFYGSVDRS